MNIELRTIQLRLTIQNQLDKREVAKADKDFETADAIRETLVSQGVTINDTPYGPTWTYGRVTYGSINCLEDLKVVTENEIKLRVFRDEIAVDRAAFVKKHDRPSTPPDYEGGK